MAHPAVSIGLLLPTREVVMASGAPDLSKIIDLAVRAEELGFDSVWVGDSILARPRLEAMTTLAAVASRTQRVKLGTAVLLPALRHPVVLANETANVDILSQGRLILGLGVAANNESIAREFTSGSLARSTTRNAGFCAWEMAGSPSRVHQRSLPRNGRGCKCWRGRWAKTRRRCPAVSTPR